mmetsp:Transcript_44319/g.117281  ORF Transcript_44319/g.117281 Transcript_44319/m.117281 type:complete len:150 (+) Transcript_44319:196-645(+)
MEALKRAMAKAEDLKTVPNARTLFGIIAELESLPVSADLLQKTMLPKVLQETVRRFPAALGAGHRLRIRWRDAFRQDLAKLKEAADSPSAAVAKASQDDVALPHNPTSIRGPGEKNLLEGLVPTPPGKPLRKQQRQQRITAFLKAPVVS